jgi:hypothetical protein
MARWFGTLFLCGSLYAGVPQARVPDRQVVIVLCPREPDLTFLWAQERSLGTGPSWVRMDAFEPSLILVRRPMPGMRFLQEATEAPCPPPAVPPVRKARPGHRPPPGRPMELVIRVESVVISQGVQELSNPGHRWR